MTITIHADSHTDHDLSEEALAFVLQRTEEERSADLGHGLVIHTVTLPEGFESLPCALIGPKTGHPPVRSAYMAKRLGRDIRSRLVHAAPTWTRQVTVIVGEHDGDSAVLFTAFGGPSTPKETEDPYLKDEEREASEAFWSEHALADGGALDERPLVEQPYVNVQLQLAADLMRTELRAQHLIGSANRDVDLSDGTPDDEDAPTLELPDGLCVFPRRLRNTQVVWVLRETTEDDDGANWLDLGAGSLARMCALAVGHLTTNRVAPRFERSLL